MNNAPIFSRRDVLRGAAMLAGASLLSDSLMQSTVGAHEGKLLHVAETQSGKKPALGALEEMRRGMAQAPVELVRLDATHHVAMGHGGNIGVLSGSDGILLVDSGSKYGHARIVEKLKEVSSAPTRMLINTHWHWDHTDGNVGFGSEGATILAHENVKKRLSKQQSIPIMGTTFEPIEPIGRPVMTFSDEISFRFANEDVRVVHFKPAHTDSDSVIHFVKADVVHTGDLFFNGMYPFIDPYSGGSIDGMIRSSNRLLALTNNRTRIIPGHGNVGNRADLTRFRDMLMRARDLVADFKGAGRTLDETVKSKPTESLDAQWGKGFLTGDFFTAIVYMTLPKKP